MAIEHVAFIMYPVTDMPRAVAFSLVRDPDGNQIWLHQSKRR
jgi:hypothetical protein